MLKAFLGQIAVFITNILKEGVEFTEGFVITYGLSALIAASLARGFMLFWVAPDEAVTIAYVLFYSETVYQVAGIVIISSICILIANSLVFLLFRWLGEKLISEERKAGKIYRFLNWAFDRNGKFSILLFRMTPLIGGDWVAIFSGITDMHFKDYFIYSLVGILFYEALVGFGAYYGLKMGMLYEMEIPFLRFFIDWLETALA
ncbi:MAG: VTT domain-containing protein [Candidatus Aenigmatarchaeota archaeon]